MPVCDWQDSLAEWSKALASGASPQGRGFEPHSCHFLVAETSSENLSTIKLMQCSSSALAVGTCFKKCSSPFASGQHGQKEEQPCRLLGGLCLDWDCYTLHVTGTLGTHKHVKAYHHTSNTVRKSSMYTEPPGRARFLGWETGPQHPQHMQPSLKARASCRNTGKPCGDNGPPSHPLLRHTWVAALSTPSSAPPWKGHRSGRSRDTTHAEVSREGLTNWLLGLVA